MHQHKRIVYAICLAIILQAAPGCKKGWLDINYDPQQLTDSKAEPYHLLPVHLRDYIPAGGDLLLNNWMGYSCPPPPYPLGTPLTTYAITQEDANFPLGGGVVANSNVMRFEEKARDRGQDFYLGIVKVIKAMIWTRGVDARNNIPYLEFNKVDILRPKYDEGKFIYEQEMKQLDSAIGLIKNANTSKNPRIAQTDIMFHADKSKWMKFINTVKLRLLVHQANRPDRQAYIQAEIAKIQAEGSGFLGSGEDAAVNPGYLDYKVNPFYSKYSKNARFPGAVVLRNGAFFYSFQLASANIVFLDKIKQHNDPRLGFIFQPIESPLPPGFPEPFPQPAPGNYRGNKLGLPVNPVAYPFQAAQYVSQLKCPTGHLPVTATSSGIIKGYDMAKWVITSVESLFLQAEAIQRGWIPGNAELAYKEAVKESFRWLNTGENSAMPSLSDDIFNNWYNGQVAANNPEVSWAAAPDKYKLLMLQKYLAFHTIEPFEAWTDYRRNGGFPYIPPSLDPDRIGNSIPIRYPYYDKEYLRNADNVNAQGTINIFTSKIWWMP